MKSRRKENQITIKNAEAEKTFYSLSINWYFSLIFTSIYKHSIVWFTPRLYLDPGSTTTLSGLPRQAHVMDEISTKLVALNNHRPLLYHPRDFYAVLPTWTGSHLMSAVHICFIVSKLLKECKSQWISNLERNHAAHYFIINFPTFWISSKAKLRGGDTSPSMITSALATMSWVSITTLDIDAVAFTTRNEKVTAERDVTAIAFACISCRYNEKQIYAAFSFFFFWRSNERTYWFRIFALFLCQDAITASIELH